MLTNDLEAYYIFKDEPHRGCLLALRSIILNFDPEISEAFKWKLPFFTYNGSNLCYFHIAKKTQQLYIGIYRGKDLHHPSLIAGDRTVIKILPVDPEKDIPVETIKEVLTEVLSLYN